MQRQRSVIRPLSWFCRLNRSDRSWEIYKIIERTDKDLAIGIQHHPEAVIDKSADCQTNASDYMSYEDILEVFAHLIDLVR